MNKTLLGYIRLTRPANLITAIADICAGFAIANGFYLLAFDSFNFHSTLTALIIILASICLYAGGVVLNDVFDYQLDQLERPERPIPSGVVPLKKAAIFGGLLLCLGVILAFFTSVYSAIIAGIISLFILTYNSYTKHSVLLGPLNMGLCRGLNLMLGTSLLGFNSTFFYLTIIPILYIAAITLISQGEVTANNKKMLVIAAIMYVLVFIILLGLSWWFPFNLLHATPFLILLFILIFKPLINAYQNNTPINIKKAVKSGVISLIILDACITAGFSLWWIGIFIVALLPISLFLAKKFAVT